MTEAIASGSGIVEVWSTEFVVGVRDIESDKAWTEYLRELERAGVERYVELWRKTLRDAGY